MLTTDGFQPDKTKVDAIVKLALPTNKQELRSLVGMVTYLARFIPNSSALLEPLRALLKDNVHYTWEPEHEHAFKSIKQAIVLPCNLQYFNHKADTEIQCDASLKGLGACMIQNGQPVSYASKSLTDTESRYSNIEREMLGVVFALTRFHQYTYGRAVTVVTDHKPLESLNKRNINDCPARLQRMLLRLQCYTYTIVYRPGSKIPVPDCLSRLIHNRQDPEIPGMHIQVNDVTLTHPSKLDIIRNHMKKDEDLLLLRDMVLRGWPSNRSDLQATLLPYWTYKDELACYNGVLLKGDRVVIPSSLVSQVLKDIHRGHLGIEKSRLRARRCVFWPNMNVDISKMISQCSTCQTYAGPQPKHYSYNMKSSYHYPMQCVGTDIFEYRGVNYLIDVDYFSSYPWIRSLKNITTKSTIGALKTIFTEFGYPQRIHSDAGSQYTSNEFKQFCTTNDISHTTSSPYYHESNGLAERYVGIVKTIMKKNPEMINDALLAYRAAPLTNNEYSPAELMFKRNVKAHMISLPVHFPTDDRSPENVNPIEQKEKHPQLYPGDRVFIYDTEKKTWERGIVRHQTEQPNQYSIRFDTGRIADRNCVHLKPDVTTPATIQDSQLSTTSDSEFPSTPLQGLLPEPKTQLAMPDLTQNPSSLSEALSATTNLSSNHTTTLEPSRLPVDNPSTYSDLRRSNRVRHKPTKLQDYTK